MLEVVRMPQPSKELSRKAQVWLDYSREVHLVVLIDTQQVHQPYTDKDGKVVCKSAAGKLGDQWRLKWQEPRRDGDLWGTKWLKPQIEGRIVEVGAVNGF